MLHIYNIKINPIHIIYLIILPLFIALFISCLFFFIDLTIQKFYLPISFIISILFYKLMIKPSFTNLFFNTLIALCIYILSFIISNYFYDLSADGQTYHQETIISLKEGWNPILKESKAKSGKIWVENYPKGIEIIQANIYSLTNKIETGKSINLLLLICSFLLSIDCLKYLKLKKYKIYVYSLLICLNPICISQLLTYYVDGIFYSFILCIILSSTLIILSNKCIYYLIFLSSLVIGSSIKFTSIPVIGCLIFFILLLTLVIKRYDSFKKLLYISLFSGLICFPIITFNPYITNILNGKNIFYPLAGEGAIDIITPFVPEKFNNLNRFEKFWVSLISKSGRLEYNDNYFKLPFSIYKKEMSRLVDADIGAAGFGIFYSGIILLTLITIIIYFFKQKLKLNYPQKILLYACFAIFISVFIIPEPFWFRYIPQFYLIPLLFLIIIEISNYSYKYLPNTIFLIYFLNIFLIMFINLAFNIYTTENIKYQLAQIKNRNKIIKVQYRDFPSNLIRFEENNIKYKLVHFSKGEKYMYIYPYKNDNIATRIEYFEYNPKIKKNFILRTSDKIFNKIYAEYKK